MSMQDWNMLYEQWNEICQCGNNHAAIKTLTKVTLMRLKINTKYPINAMGFLNVVLCSLTLCIGCIRHTTFSFMVYILLYIYLYSIYLSIGQSTQQFLQWQNKHYCVNICLLCACDVVPLHVSTLLLVIFRHVRIQASVTELLWIILHTLSNFELKN
jgi:hypothetical protein